MEKWAFLKNSKAHSSHAKQTSKIKKLILTAHCPKKLQKSSAPNIAYIVVKWSHLKQKFEEGNVQEWLHAYERNLSKPVKCKCGASVKRNLTWEKLADILIIGLYGLFKKSKQN